MKVEITVPAVGESINEGYLAAWLVSDGSQVQEGQSIFELETEKTTMMIGSPATGQISISVEAETDVSIGQTVGSVDTEAAVQAAPSTAAAASDSGIPPAAQESAGAAKSEGRITPAAKAEAARAGINPASIAGTGRAGMITKADIQTAPGSTNSTAQPDVQTAAKSIINTEIRKPLSRLRRAVAANLTRTRDELVLLTTFNEADLSSIKGIRARYGQEFQETHGVKLGFMSFFLKAAAAALTAYPEVNAHIDSTTDEIVYPGAIHIAVAVSTPRGLITPVLRNVPGKSFADIEKEIIGYSQKAANKTLVPEELAGGTFTVTNGGIFGSLMSTPLPAPNQSAILGMHTIQDRPVARNGEILIRPMMYLALSYDHRLIDGREAVGCLKAIKEAVESPERLLFEL